METVTHGKLLQAALRARERAVAPYSNYRVGAALLADEGRVFTGCNIESSSFGLTICAERVALFKAVSEGVRSFTAIAVTAGRERPCTPCGACRQVLWEHARDLVVITGDGAGNLEERKLADLFPEPFDQSILEGS
jgi:cytidine deaminase